MSIERIDQIKNGLATAFIDKSNQSNLAYRPEFVSNDYRSGKKVLASIERELQHCDSFAISVAFITDSGIEALMMTLQELKRRGIPGRILTTDYLMFSDPKALRRLHEIGNLDIRMYRTRGAEEGFHTKGYIFRQEEIYRIIVGSSNMTRSALTVNKEWNTRIISTEQGEMAQEIIAEFESLWNDKKTDPFDVFYGEYLSAYQQEQAQKRLIAKITEEQKNIAAKGSVTSLAAYKLKPNLMQVTFIENLKKIIEAGKNRALLISATGTGKTYASAFAMRELGFKRVLFIAHRDHLIRQTVKSYRNVFANTIRMGVYSGKSKERDADYIFAMIETLHKDENLRQFDPHEFSAVIIDESHHASAGTYQKVMNYFKPDLWLGMTATPDKRDDVTTDRNIYEIFDHEIACEIRLQDAMENDLLCPFHYFGISDIDLISDNTSNTSSRISTGNASELNFNLLTSDERIRHIIRQAHYYNYSGSRVKGLIFCSRVDESNRISEKLNRERNPETGRLFRTISLNGSSDPQERQDAFDRLAQEEDDENALDYIVSVDILNEGTDIVEVNQVIMLRPTQSPIVFIQQLGRGLRKCSGKEYVVILDFIGNYRNNFMIPVALSGDRTYNPDNIRKYVISGNRIIPGASTIHFDEISREKIFHAIDHIRGIKDLIRQSYISLKNRLGRVPYLMDFYASGEVDPLLIIREYKTYAACITSVDKDVKLILSEKEKVILEYYSKTILSGTRAYELEILRELLEGRGQFDLSGYYKCYESKYGERPSQEQIEDSIRILQGHFVSKEEEYTKKYYQVDLLKFDEDARMMRLSTYAERLEHAEFYKQLKDIVAVGLARYDKYYRRNRGESAPFVLYEKYSRRDISLLMNQGKDMSSTMFGMKRIDDDVFIFITYHKQEAGEDQNYIDGKPDYADEFDDNITFRWDSQIGRGPESGYVKDVLDAPRKHLFVKKSDNETSFYYMGGFTVDEYWGAEKENNNHKMQAITKFRFKMNHPVREDLLNYFESAMLEEK